MQEISKNPKNNKLMKTVTFSVVLLLAATMLFSSAQSAITIQSDSMQVNGINQASPAPGVSNYRLPDDAMGQAATKQAQNPVLPAGFLGETAYACDIYPNFHSIYFDTDVPGTLTQIAGLTSYDFIAGGTWANGAWYGVEYAAYGNANFWTIDETTGAMTLIGATGSSDTLNGLAYDDITATMYACSGTNLYTIDVSTGTATLVGAMGNAGGVMIGLACDNAGNLYGEDLGDDNLYSIDTGSGAATIIGSLGIDLNYAQDMEYDKNNDILYLSALTIQAGNEGALYTCNPSSGATTYIGMFDGTLTEVAGFAIPYVSGPPPEHDVGVQSINSPVSGPAGVITPEVAVKNYGNYSETTDVQLQIFKQAYPDTALSEGFEVSVPPTGWTTGGYGFVQATDGYVGNCAKASYSGYGQWADLTTSTFDASAGGYQLQFWHKQLVWAGDQDTLEVMVSNDDGSTWTTIAYYPSSMDWTYETFDLDTYITPTSTMKIYFYATLDYGYGVYLDEIAVNSFGTPTLEYDETEFVTLAAGGTEIVTFDDWTPADWQVSENVGLTYDVVATTLLVDDNPSNDVKTSSPTLDYPYLHDIAVVSIDSPSDDGPGQTYPVECTIKNVGQFSECCYQTMMEIGEEMGSFVDEDFSGVTPPSLPSGWNTNYPSNWITSNTNYAGGTAPELEFYFSPSATDTFRCYTDPLDTTGYTNMNLNFKMYVSHYATPYDLAVETSTDGITWNTVWTIPGQSVPATDMSLPLTTADGLGSSTFRISFTFIGYSWNINYWCIDNIELKAPSIVGEYEDTVCTIELDPGEEATLEFDDWTPDALGLGLSGSHNYLAIGTQMLMTDTNPANDMAISEFTLDYWHDVLVKEITEPSISRDMWDLQFSFDVTAASGGAGNTGIEFDGTYFYTTRWASDLIHQYDSAGVLQKEFSITGVSGLRDLAYCPLDGHFYGGAAANTLYEMDFDSETLINSYAMPVAVRSCAYDEDNDAFWVNNWGDTISLVDRSGTILDTIPNTISMYSSAWDGISDGGPFLWIFSGTTSGGGCQIEQYEIATGTITGEGHTVGAPGELIAGGLGATPDFVSGTYTLMALGQGDGGLPDTVFCYEVAVGGPSGGGYPPITVWTNGGSTPIEAIVGNEGVFEETGLTAYAEVYQFIDDPENGTYVWDDSVSNIDLDPLGDEVTIPFGSVDFNMEGPWGVYIDFPLGTDDYPNNNVKELGVGVDNTDPSTTHSLDPPDPTGCNGWYSSDVTVTLTASDGDDDWDSGVAEMKYRIDGGTIQTITGFTGSFVIHDDGDDIEVEYWAIDNVGNEESPHKTFTVDMDQTAPGIDLSFEVTGGGPNTGWDITFTATATDDMSGMERVDFLINDILQISVPGSGPTYQWSIEYYPLPHVFFKAIAYDMACNDYFDELEDPVAHAQQVQQMAAQKVLIRMG